MKKLIVIALACMVTAGSFAQTGIKDNNKQKNKKKMKTIQLTTAGFMKKVADIRSTGGNWKYLGDKPALIDFYADWCGPCKMIAPILNELAEEYEGQIYIYKVDTERESELAAAFGIRSIPALLFVPMEGQPQMASGAMSKEGFKELIEEILLGGEPQAE